MEIHELKPVYEQILDHVAEKYGMSAADVSDIWRANFEFMKFKMESDSDPLNGYFPTFLIQGFCKFKTSHNSREKMKALKKKRIENGANRTKSIKPVADDQSNGVHNGAIQEDSGQGQEQG